MNAGVMGFVGKQRRREKEERLRELHESFLRFDKDGDGELSQEEWMEVMRDTGSEMSR